MNNKKCYLEKLFEYITSFIINKNIINKFHEKLVDYDNIIDKSNLNYHNEQFTKNLKDVYEFIDSFLKTSELQEEFDIYLNKLKIYGYKLRDDLLNNQNIKILEHILNFYKKILTEYFDYTNKFMTPVYINMFYEYIICETDDEKTRMYTSIVKGGGPVLLKVLQEYPMQNKNFDKEVLLVISKVFDSLTTISDLELDLLLPYLSLKSLDKNALKVGSIGQVHYGTTYECKTENNIIIKFIKPRSLLYFLCEIHMLNNLDYNTSVDLKSYNYTKYKLYKIGKEYSFKEEYENATTLEKMYNYKYIKTVKMIRYNENLIPYVIMNIAEGIPLQTLIQRNTLITTPELLCSFKHLVHVWLTNMILGNGIVHADLHPGNIIIDVSHKIPTITIIDFGNVGKLDIYQQQYIFQLFELHLEITNCIIKGVDVKEKYYIALVDIFSKFSKIKYCDSEIDFLKCVLIDNYEIKKTKVLGDILQELISKSSNAGEIINGSIVDFGRGMCILENTWKKIEPIDDLINAYSKILRYSPYTLLRILFKKIYFSIYAK